MPQANISSFIQPPTLITPRLTLRAIESADRDGCTLAIAESWDFWMPWFPAQSMTASPAEQFEKRLAGSIAGWASGTSYALAAFDQTGRYIGDCSINGVIRGAFQTANIGWALRASAQGQGFAFEMVRATLDWAFASSPNGAELHRLQAFVQPDNARSIALTTRLGFRQEGIAKAAILLQGEWQDYLMFAKLAREHIGM